MMSFLPLKPLPRGKLAKRFARSGFSLVEVTIALGLVSYALIALLGLFVVGLNASRDSSRETALGQIMLHARSTYNPTNPPVNFYNNEGFNTTNVSERYFQATYTPLPYSVANTSTNFQLVKIDIVSLQGSRTTNTIQAAVFTP